MKGVGTMIKFIEKIAKWTPNIKLESLLVRWISDLDFKSYYPSATICLNVSRETMKTAIFQIVGWGRSVVQDFCSKSMMPKENSVALGKEFFNLPGYVEMDKLIEKELEKQK